MNGAFIHKMRIDALATLCAMLHKEVAHNQQYLAELQATWQLQARLDCMLAVQLLTETINECECIIYKRVGEKVGRELLIQAGAITIEDNQ